MLGKSNQSYEMFGICYVPDGGLFLCIPLTASLGERKIYITLLSEEQLGKERNIFLWIYIGGIFLFVKLQLSMEVMLIQRLWHTTYGNEILCFPPTNLSFPSLSSPFFSLIVLFVLCPTFHLSNRRRSFSCFVFPFPPFLLSSPLLSHRKTELSLQSAPQQ